VARACITLALALGALAVGGCGDDNTGDGPLGDLASGDRAIERDLTASVDAAGSDAAGVDQSVPSDLAVPVDAAGVDQSVPSDAAKVLDLSVPDLAKIADLRIVNDLTGPPPDLRVLTDLTAPPPDMTPAVHVVTVGEGGFFFTPAQLTIPVGDTVQWVWKSSGHSVVSGTNGNADGVFCSPNNANCAAAPTSAAGAVYSRTFTVAKSYPYFCGPHALLGMTGTITVQ
jgi:plastocyanin